MVLLWICFGVTFVSFGFPFVLHWVLLGSPLVSFRCTWDFPRASFGFDGVCFGFLEAAGAAGGAAAGAAGAAGGAAGKSKRT